MQISYFLSWHAGASETPVPPIDAEAVLECLRDWARDVTALTRYVVHTRSVASDPYGDDVDGPVMVLQCYFDDALALDIALAANGAFARLLQHAALRHLTEVDGCKLFQQAMLTRRYALPCGDEAAHETTRCTYLVAYEKGTASTDGFDTWLADYLTHHVPLLKSFPGLRELEVYTPIHWTSALPYPRAQAAQRNKVVFDDAPALTGALHSPVRHALREHAMRAPSLGGGSTHYPMTSRTFQLKPTAGKETT